MLRAGQRAGCSNGDRGREFGGVAFRCAARQGSSREQTVAAKQMRRHQPAANPGQQQSPLSVVTSQQTAAAQHATLGSRCPSGQSAQPVQQQTQRSSSCSRSPPSGGQTAFGSGAPGPLCSPAQTLAQGLSRRVRDVAQGRPRLVRAGALAFITVSFSTAAISQVIAPGFIDPALGEETPLAAACRSCCCCLCRSCHLLLHARRCGWLPPPAHSLHI